MASLRTRVVHGVGWRSAADVSQLLLQIGFTAILARLLDIADFGLVAMCLIFLRFVRSFTDIGFGSAVIQRQDITEGQVSAIFVLQAAIKLGVCLICVAAAPLAATFFEEPQLTPLIRVLSIGIVLDGLAFPQTLLRKRLEFRGYSIVEIVSLVVGGALGVIMAFTGFGVWSLVARWMLGKFVNAVGVWLVARWRPQLPQFRDTGGILRFSLSMFAARSANFWSENLAAIVLGKLLGAETLGLFNVAYNLAIVPAQKVQSVLTTVLGPVFSASQDNVADMRRRFRMSLFSLGAALVPMMVGLSGVASYVVVVLYGEKWQPAGEFLMILALAGLCKGFSHLLYSMLIMTGHPQIYLTVTIVEVTLNFLFVLLGYYVMEATGVLAGYALSAALALLLCIQFVERSQRQPYLFISCTRKPLLISACMWIAVSILGIAGDGPPALILVSQISMGFALYVVLFRVFLASDEKKILKTWPVVGRVLP